MSKSMEIAQQELDDEDREISRIIREVKKINHLSSRTTPPIKIRIGIFKTKLLCPDCGGLVILSDCKVYKNGWYENYKLHECQSCDYKVGDGPRYEPA